MSSTLAAPDPLSVSPERITFTDDCHAWWVVDDEPASMAESFIHSCGYCSRGVVYRDLRDDNGILKGTERPCPECGGSGDFTFRIWVNAEQHRVSIVRGMIREVDVKWIERDHWGDLPPGAEPGMCAMMLRIVD